MFAETFETELEAKASAGLDRECICTRPMPVRGQRHAVAVSSLKQRNDVGGT